MSFALTVDQVKAGTKTVTRRLGWWRLKPGDVVIACERCMGLKRGERVARIRPIRITSTGPEMLAQITRAEVKREGFPEMTPGQFVELFCTANRCAPDRVVNRIAFEYMQKAATALDL